MGKDCNQPGNMANKAKGIAIAMENPAMPTTGAMILPDDAASTKRNPIMGPVQENDTMVRVRAIKKIPQNPDPEAFRSVPVLQPAGSVIWKTPKKERAKKTSIRKKRILTIALVDSALSAFAPNIRVMPKPIATYTAMMDRPYANASRTAFFLLDERFIKKLTVIGMIGQTQGVKRASNPPRKLVRNSPHRLVLSIFVALMLTGAQVSGE